MAERGKRLDGRNGKYRFLLEACIYNLLEVEGIPVILANAQHMKNAPGRKTDMKDAEWIADLLKHGLLKKSFVPKRDGREEIVRRTAKRIESLGFKVTVEEVSAA
jgi:transposase